MKTHHMYQLIDTTNGTAIVSHKSLLFVMVAQNRQETNQARNNSGKLTRTMIRTHIEKDGEKYIPTEAEQEAMLNAVRRGVGSR